MTTELTPRAAVALCIQALPFVDKVEPEVLRDPIRALLSDAAERCIGTRSLTGKPVLKVLAIARELVGEYSVPAASEPEATPEDLGVTSTAEDHAEEELAASVHGVQR